MTLKTLGKTTWDKIKVGEVYAAKFSSGEWVVEEKTDKLGNSLPLSSYCRNFDFSGGENTWNLDGIVYKLPLSIQRLWRQDT